MSFTNDCIHLHNGKTPGATVQFDIVGRVSRTCKNKLSFCFTIVNFVPYIIPNFGMYLPLVN